MRTRTTIRRRLPTTLQRTGLPTTFHRCSRARLPPTLLRMTTRRRRRLLRHPRNTQSKSGNVNESDKITLRLRHHRHHRPESPSEQRERWKSTRITTMMERMRRRAWCPQADLGRGQLPAKARPVLRLALTDVLRMVLACRMARRRSSSLLKPVAPLSLVSDDCSKCISRCSF